MNSMEPRIDLFCCASNVDTDELVRRCREGSAHIKAIPLPCSGKVDILYLTKAFEAGADGVAVVTCKEGDCRYMEGNLRALKRAQAVDSLVDEAGLGRGRTAVIRLGDGGVDQAVSDFKVFRQRIKPRL